jgi:hypothetical protein
MGSEQKCGKTSQTVEWPRFSHTWVWEIGTSRNCTYKYVHTLSRLSPGRVQVLLHTLDRGKIEVRKLKHSRYNYCFISKLLQVQVLLQYI